MYAQSTYADDASSNGVHQATCRASHSLQRRRMIRSVSSQLYSYYTPNRREYVVGKEL